MSEENRKEPINKYLSSKIYKLQCDDGYFYIGSTTQPLCKRLYDHKLRSNFIQYKGMKIYKHINLIGWNRVKIILISEHVFNNKEQIIKQENLEIEKYFNDGLCLNSYHSFTEYENIDVPKKAVKYNNAHYIDNKEKYKERSRLRYANNKEEISRQSKERYLKNKKLMTIKNKIYNNNNKDKSFVRNEKIMCECGCEISKRNISVHRKCKKHLAYVTHI